MDDLFSFYFLDYIACLPGIYFVNGGLENQENIEDRIFQRGRVSNTHHVGAWNLVGYLVALIAAVE